jgi:HEAT repeat protein
LTGTSANAARMGNKCRLLLLVLLSSMVGAALWFFIPSPEPVYKGEPLGYWLDCYFHSGRSSPTNTPAQADEAIRQMGTKCIPILLRMLQEPDPDLQDRMWAVMRKHGLVKTQYPPDRLNNIQALTAFIALGPLASNAVPELILMLENDSSLFAQQAIPRILGAIGPAAEPAVPLLLQRTTDSNAYVRVNSITALGQIRACPQSVVPVLIKSLNDPFVSARIEAARSLGAFRTDAQAAVPALLELQRRELLNSAPEPAFVLLPGGGYYPRTGSNGTGPMRVTKELGWPVWPKDVLAAATNALKQIDPAAVAQKVPN